jgi:hypothetical protein
MLPVERFGRVLQSSYGCASSNSRMRWAQLLRYASSDREFLEVGAQRPRLPPQDGAKR